MLLTITICALVWLIGRLRMKDPAPIANVYMQKGKWYHLKFYAFWLLLELRKWWNRNASSNDLSALERPLTLSEHPKAFDAVFFIGANSDGYRMTFGVERRKLGLAQGVLYFVIPKLGLLSMPRMPDTILFGTANGKDSTDFEAEGLRVEPIVPLKHWRLSYRGQLKHNDKLVNVEFKADYTSNFGVFDFNTSLHPKLVAESIAKEHWTSHFFDHLKRAHQSHYEQMGNIKGTLTVDGTPHSINLQAFRDHSHGLQRDWSLLHRYIYFVLFMNDGRSAVIGIISQPCTGSELKIGYIVSAKGRIDTMDWCDFSLYQHGEGGEPPRDHAFQFKTAGNDQVYTVQIKVECQSEHFGGSKWEARLVERFFKCDVNGISGYGVSECHYNNRTGRPDEVASVADPLWYREIQRKERIYANNLRK